MKTGDYMIHVSFDISICKGLVFVEVEVKNTSFWGSLSMMLCDEFYISWVSNLKHTIVCLKDPSLF